MTFGRHVFLHGSYLNNQHIRKQKMSDAELTYGSLSIDHSEQMKEIGELGLETWKKLVRLGKVSLLHFNPEEIMLCILDDWTHERSIGEPTFGWYSLWSLGRDWLHGIHAVSVW